MSHCSPEALSSMMDDDAVHKLHLGKNFERFEESSDGITLYFDNGETAKCDILIAADGYNSPIRLQFTATLNHRMPGTWSSVAATREPRKRLLEPFSVCNSVEGARARKATFAHASCCLAWTVSTTMTRETVTADPLQLIVWKMGVSLQDRPRNLRSKLVK